MRRVAGVGWVRWVGLLSEARGPSGFKLRFASANEGGVGSEDAWGWGSCQHAQGRQQCGKQGSCARQAGSKCSCATFAFGIARGGSKIRSHPRKADATGRRGGMRGLGPGHPLLGKQLLPVSTFCGFQDVWARVRRRPAQQCGMCGSRGIASHVREPPRPIFSLGRERPRRRSMRAWHFYLAVTTLSLRAL